MVPNGLFSPTRALTSRPRIHANTRVLQIGAAAFALALMGGGAASAQEIWTGEGVDQFWSTPGNWLDGTPPSPGGEESLALHFTHVREGILRSKNDLPGAFTLNRLVLGNQSSQTLFIEPHSVAGGTPTSSPRLRLAGANPEIVLDGSGTVDITAPLILDSADGRVRITGTGQGNLFLSSPILEGSTKQSLVIATTQKSSGTQLVYLPSSIQLEPDADNKMLSGGLVLESGTAVASGSLGLGPIYFEGGALRISGPTPVSSPMVLRADAEIDLRITNNISIASIASEIAGAGVTFRGSAVASPLASTLNNATYTGPTKIGLSRDAAVLTTESESPIIIITGTSNLKGPISVSSGGRLRITNAAPGEGRIGDQTPVSLRRGTLEFAGGTGTGVQRETVGAVDGAGYSILSLSASSSPGTLLTAQALTRTERGTFLFRGAKLGAAMAAGVGNIVFNTAPTGLVGGGGTGANVSILPWAIGDAVGSFSEGASFVTYSSTTGIRPLNLTAEYTNLASAGATSNVRVTTASLGFNGDRTINSLLLDGGYVAGSGILTITSGALFQRSGAGVTNPIAFGAAEGNIFTVADLELPGTISGTGGLTKSAKGTLTLSGNNSFTGQLTVNAGTIAFPTLESLGADTSAIVLAGMGAGLRYTGSSPLTFARPIESKDGFAVLSAPAGDLTITSQISGVGGLSLSGGANSTLALIGENTYRGITQITGGRVSIDGDAALGAGGALALGGGTLAVTSGWVTDREVYLGEASSDLPTTSGTLDTGENDVVWNGVVRGILKKSGLGSLTLSQPALLQRIDALTGSLVLTKEGALPIGTLSLTHDSALRLDNSAMPHTNRLLDDAVVALQGSSFSLTGHQTQEVSERIAQFSLAFFGGNTISITAPGTAGVTLHLSEGISGDSGTAVLRAARLGGAAATPYERLVVDTSDSYGPGIVPGVLADPGLTGIGTHFVVYDGSSDAAGVIGFRPLGEEAYTRGSVLRNPVNEGTTEQTAHFLAGGDMTATGAMNTVESLTLEGSGNLILHEGQTIELGSGRILLRGGDSAATFSGGTLDFGSARGEIYAGRDLAVSSALAGAGGFLKSGPGTLTLTGNAGYTGLTQVVEGTLKTGTGDPLASQRVFVASGARLDVSGGATAINALSVSSLNLGSSTLTVGQLGGSSSFKGISGAGQIILQNGGEGKATHIFGGSNEAFTGMVRLDAGHLQLGAPSALGGASLLVRGGTLSAGSALPRVLDIALEADLELRGSQTLSLAPGTSITGAHDVVLRGAGGLSITGPLSLAGRLRTEAASVGDFVLSPGTINIRGAGTLSVLAGVQISTGGKLSLEYRQSDTAGPNSRLGDANPVTLQGGTLELASMTDALSPTPVNSVETVGPIVSKGRSLLSIHNNGASAQLTGAYLSRSDRGTFLLNSTSGTFGGALATNVGQIRFTSAPELIGGNGTGANTSILPWAAGSQAAGSSGLITFGTNGARVLAGSDYAATLASAEATNNVLINFGGQTHTETRTINSLTLQGPLLGNGTLNITSGAVALTVNNTQQTLISNNLAFGEREAIFHIPAATLGGINVTGVISGTGGLTLSAATGSTLTLAGNNSFSGPVTINGGKLSFAAANHLGASMTPIALHGHNSVLSFSGMEASLSLSRDIDLRGGVSRLEASGINGVFDVANRLTGVGGLRVTGPGAVNLGATNSYGGSTILEGTAVIGSDAALGAGGIFFAGGRLKLEESWATERPVIIQTFGTLDTNGFNAVLRGTIESTGNGPFIKAGMGSLRIEDSQLAAALQVIEGEVRFADAGHLGITGLYLASQGRFVLDNSARIAGRRPSPTKIYLSGGELQIGGHATQQVLESIGAVTSSTNSAGIVTVGGVGQAPVSLISTEFTSTAGAVLFRGENLGSEGGSRLVFGKSPEMIAGVIAGALADRSAIGHGTSFATYDSRSDDNGVIGVRPLADVAFATGNAIDNTGGLSTLANFRALGPLSATGSTSRINSLRLSAGADLQLTSLQTLGLGAPGLLVDAGTTAEIAGGTLRTERSGFAHVIGDLALASRVLGTLTKTGPGTLSLQQGANITGAVSVLGGTLEVETPAALRNSAVFVGAAGIVQVDSPAASIAKLHGSGTASISAGSLLTVGTLEGVQTSGNGGLALTKINTVTTPLKHVGTTFFSGSPGTWFNLNEGGEILNTDRLVVTASSVILDTRTRTAPRIAAVPVDLDGGKIGLLTSSLPASQSFGALGVRGTSQISMDHRLNGMEPRAELSFESLVRRNRGAVAFSSNRPGSGDVFRFTDAPTNAGVGAGTRATNKPVLPYAMYSWSAPGTFTTLDTFATIEPGVGIRPLSEAEISSALTTGDNVRINSAISIEAPTRVNALIASAHISGPHALEIESGLLISNHSNFAHISTPVDFGAAEANVFSTSGSGLILSGSLSGSNGLTKNGDGHLSINGTYGIAGPLTLNGGSLSFEDPAQLNNALGGIYLHTGSLSYSGVPYVSITQPIQLIGLSTRIHGNLRITQPVTGSGGLERSQNLILDFPPAYTGPTTLLGLYKVFSEDFLGTSSKLQLANGSALEPVAPLHFQREVEVLAGRSTMVGYGYNAELSRLTGSGTLNKQETGVLTVADGGGFTGTLEIEAGTLEVTGSIGGAVNIGLNGIVTGDGSFSILTVRGIADPSGEGTGAFQTASFIAPDAELRFTLASASDYDQIITTDRAIVARAGFSLELSPGFDPVEYVDSFTLIRNDSVLSDAFSGRLVIADNEVSEGDTFVLESQEWLISYTGGDGNDLVLYAVPEPSPLLIALLGTGLLGFRSPRRRTEKASGCY